MTDTGFHKRGSIIRSHTNFLRATPISARFRRRKYLPYLALYPGLPMFFNVSHERLGRPGRYGDVMNTVSLSPPTQCSTRREASQHSKWHSGTNYVQAKASESRELPTKQQRRELEINVVPGATRFTVVATSSV